MAQARKPPFLVCCSANVQSLLASPPDRLRRWLKTTRVFFRGHFKYRGLTIPAVSYGIWGHEIFPVSLGFHHFYLIPNPMVILGGISPKLKPLYEVAGGLVSYNDPMMEGAPVRQPQGRFVPHVDAVPWACKSMYTYPLKFNVYPP